MYALQNPDSNDHMAYWLSNMSILLSLLQRSLKASGSNSQQKPPVPPTSFFGRMAQVIIYFLRLQFELLFFEYYHN